MSAVGQKPKAIRPQVGPLSPLGAALYPILVLFRKGSRKERLIRAHKLAKDKRLRARAERQESKKLGGEARVFERLLQDCWTRLGEAWLAKQADVSTEGRAPKKRKIQKVTFSRIFCTSERIFYQIEVNKKRVWGLTRNRLPYRVKVADLTSKETLIELSFACGRKVESRMDDPSRGAWIIVNRLEGLGGVPTYVSYEALLEHYPVDQIGRGPLILGIGENREVLTADLANHPHVLVAGGSGGGKSNIINVFICTFMRYADPNLLKMILIDFKEMELAYYDGSPFLARPVIDNPEQALQCLEELVAEIHRRASMMRLKAKELSDWNKKFPEQAMPRIIVIIDEFAELMSASGPEVRKATEGYMIRLNNLGRSVGIHTIIATQRPSSKVLPGEMKTNMPLILAARVPNWSQSMVILGHKGAADLPLLPGRLFFEDGLKSGCVQAPHLRDDQVIETMEIVGLRSKGLIINEGHLFKIDKRGLCRYALKEWGGIIDPRQVWDLLKSKKISDRVTWPAVVSKEDVTACFEDLVREGEIGLGGFVCKIETDRKNKVLRLTQTQQAAPAGEPEPEPMRWGGMLGGGMLSLPAPKPEPMTIETIAVPTPDRTKTDRDLVIEFWSECMKPDIEAAVAIQDVYEEYAQNVRGKGYRPLNLNHFGAAIREHCSPKIIQLTVSQKRLRHYAGWFIAPVRAVQSVQSAQDLEFSISQEELVS